jgi:hypothetical protein
MPWVICPILKFIELLLRMGSVPCFMAATSSAMCGWGWAGGFDSECVCVGGGVGGWVCCQCMGEKREPKRGRGEAGGKADGGKNLRRGFFWLQDLQRWPRLICSIGRTARVSRPRLCALMPHPLPDWTRCQHTCDARCLVHHNVRTSTLPHACTRTHSRTGAHTLTQARSTRQ